MRVAILVCRRFDMESIRPTDAVVSHIDVTCDRKPPNSISAVVELESSALPVPDETDLDFLDFACGLQKRMCMRCGRAETMSLKLKSYKM